MPGCGNLAGLLGLGHGGGGGGGHHHGGRGGGWGGGWWGPGYWADPILTVESLPTASPHTPGVGAKVYAAAIALKERAEHGDNSLQEAWNGTSKQVLHEPDLPAATAGFMWVFNSGPSKKTGETGNWIMYVRTGQK